MAAAVEVHGTGGLTSPAVGEPPSAHPGDDGAPPSLGALDAVVALGLLALSVVVRAGALAPSSLWLDDAWLALASRADGLGEMVMVGNTAPGFVAAEALVLGVLGFSELGAQLLPFLFGVAAAPALYLAARRCGLSAPAAAVGGALVATSPFHIVHSARVKPFTADALAAVTVLFAGWRVVERPASGRRWAAVAVVAVAAVVLSTATAPTVAGAYAAGLVAAGLGRPRSLRPALLSLAGFAAFAAGWWVVVVRAGVTAPLREYWADRYIDLAAGPGATAADLATSLAEVVRGFAAMPQALTATLLVAAAAVVMVRRPRLAVLVVTPVAVTVVLAAARLAPLGGGRTDIHLYPSLALLLAVALHVVGARLPGPAAAGVAGVAVGALVLGVRPSPPYPAQDLRPLVAAVEQRAGPDDAIAVYSASRWAYALYSGGPVDLRRDTTSANGFAVTIADERVEVLGAHRDDPSAHGPTVERLAEGHDRIWLISSHVSDDLAVVERLLGDRGLVVTASEDRPGATLTLWERMSPPGVTPDGR